MAYLFATTVRRSPSRNPYPLAAKYQDVFVSGVDNASANADHDPGHDGSFWVS